MKYYAIHVHGCIDPELKGPYSTCEIRNSAAKDLRNSDEEDVVFWLDITDNGRPRVGAYSNAFMEG